MHAGPLRASARRRPREPLSGRRHGPSLTSVPSLCFCPRAVDTSEDLREPPNLQISLWNITPFLRGGEGQLNGLSGQLGPSERRPSADGVYPVISVDSVPKMSVTASRHRRSEVDRVLLQVGRTEAEVGTRPHLPEDVRSGGPGAAADGRDGHSVASGTG